MAHEEALHTQDSNGAHDQWELIEALPDPAFVIDSISKCIVAANSAVCESSGYALEELLGLSISEIVDAEDDGANVVAINPEVLSAKDSSTTGLLRCKGGGTMRVRLGNAKSNGSRFVVGVATPEAGSAAPPPLGGNSSRWDYAGIFASSDDMFFAHDMSGRLTSLSPGALKRFGYSAAEAVGMSVLSLIDESYLGLAQYVMAEKHRKGIDVEPYELLCQKRDGSPLWIELASKVVRSEGRPDEVQGFCRDITKLKQAEDRYLKSHQENQKQQQTMERLLDQSRGAVSKWDLKGNLIGCNPLWDRLFPTEDGSPHRLDDLESLIAALPEGTLQSVRGGETYVGQDLDLTFPAKNRGARNGGQRGASLNLGITMFPLSDSTDEPVQIAIVLDGPGLSESANPTTSQLEDRLLQSQKVEAVGRLASGVAHDFNNLLTGVIGYLDLIKTVGDSKTETYADRALKAAQRGRDLACKLLAYARKSPLEVQSHDLNETVKEVVALVGQTIDPRIQIRTRHDQRAATVLADPGQMSQVLMNLVLNGCDALTCHIDDPARTGDTHHARLSIEIRHETISKDYCRCNPNGHEGDFVRLSVMDNGCGISEETRLRIFDPFFTTKPEGQGTGLGLATIDGIVKQHNGWIDVYSELGQGTVFKVYLPISDAKAEPLSTAAVSLTVRGGSESILLIDDEEMIRELGKDMLEEKGYVISLASDGMEGLQEFERAMDSIDLVVMDLTMPRLSGREVLPRLLKLKPDLKVIISSGYSDESCDDVLALGAKAFIQKPFTSLALCRAIREVLDAD